MQMNVTMLWHGGANSSFMTIDHTDLPELVEVMCSGMQVSMGRVEIQVSPDEQTYVNLLFGLESPLGFATGFKHVFAAWMQAIPQARDRGKEV